MSEYHCLNSGDLSVKLSQRGAAICSASYAGEEVLIPAGGRQADMASFPLVPFGNRVEFNRFCLDGNTYLFQPNSADPLYVHGDGWLREWSLDAIDGKTAEFSLRQSPDGSTPYDYTAWQRISVTNNLLQLDLSVRNEAADAMPFGLGHHPFFVRTPGTRIIASVTEHWSERDGHLPDKKTDLPRDLDLAAGTDLPDRFINNAFGGWSGRALIEWPELDLMAEIDTIPPHDVLMLYAPVDRKDFVCLEPMTHLPNGHHMADLGGLKILHHGATIRSRVTIKFQRYANG